MLLQRSHGPVIGPSTSQPHLAQVGCVIFRLRWLHLGDRWLIERDRKRCLTIPSVAAAMLAWADDGLNCEPAAAGAGGGGHVRTLLSILMSNTAVCRTPASNHSQCAASPSDSPADTILSPVHWYRGVLSGLTLAMVMVGPPDLSLTSEPTTQRAQVGVMPASTASRRD